VRRTCKRNWHFSVLFNLLFEKKELREVSLLQLFSFSGHKGKTLLSVKGRLKKEFGVGAAVAVLVLTASCREVAGRRQDVKNMSSVT
jgi:hypothetical protein